jgi:hypothetical protein
MMFYGHIFSNQSFVQIPTVQQGSGLCLSESGQVVENGGSSKERGNKCCH